MSEKEVKLVDDMMDEDADSEQGRPPASGQPASKKRRLVKYHRVHAHRNPLSDGLYEYPVSPDLMDWSPYYPKYFGGDLDPSPSPVVAFCDVGCGYGGLSVALAELFPDKLTLGIELRPRVVEYVEERIKKLRASNTTGAFQNVSIMNTNAMKFLPNLFRKGQLEKMFFLFPDPHFKKSNHRRRIINTALLADYAYVMALAGKLYTVTDVKDLADWMQSHLDGFPLFRRVPDEENEADPVVKLVFESSEEAKKVDKAGGQKFLAVYLRIAPVYED